MPEPSLRPLLMRLALTAAAIGLALVAVSDASAQSQSPPPGRGPAASAAGRPNIVVVVLDAARADHFGSYGYERPTTPRMDEVAAESLVFRRAYSECSNTTCSIANLITGAGSCRLG